MTMPVSVDDFMRETEAARPGRVSPLRPFKDDIKRLRASGYTYKQIVEFLAQNGVHVTVQTVSSFMYRHVDPGSKKSRATP